MPDAERATQEEASSIVVVLLTSISKIGNGKYSMTLSRIKMQKQE
jgi:hypothetical protein